MSDVMALCYHAISPDWEAPLSVTPEQFERQIESLVRAGWHSDVFSAITSTNGGAKTMLVTFDDAFASVKRYALPILDRLGLKATVFVPTRYVSAAEPFGWDGVRHWQETEHAHELTPMSWDDLRELADRGWEIGSHTSTHPHLTRLDPQMLDAELQESREVCVTELGRPCTAIAYPYGDTDDRVAQAAGRLGYLVGAGLSSSLTPHGLLRWPRIGIYHVDTSWRFRLKIARPMRALRATSLWSRSDGS